MYKVSKTGSKDVLQTTKELTYRGDGFPEKKSTFENQIFLLFLSYIFLNFSNLHLEN